MGHTLFIHKKKYDLPLSTLHKVFVAPVLHRMTTGNQQVQETEPAMTENEIDINLIDDNTTDFTLKTTRRPEEAEQLLSIASTSRVCPSQSIKKRKKPKTIPLISSSDDEAPEMAKQISSDSSDHSVVLKKRKRKTIQFTDKKTSTS